jgi:hypothetical protein
VFIFIFKNLKKLLNRPLYLSLDDKSLRSDGPTRNKEYTKQKQETPQPQNIPLYFSNVSYLKKESEIRQFFTRGGIIEISKLDLNINNGKFDGSGTIWVADDNTASKILEKNNTVRSYNKNISIFIMPKLN